MTSYKVLAPCAVRQDHGKSAVHYRQVGQVVDVQEEADAELLVRGGFLEPLADDGDAPKTGKPKTTTARNG